MNTNVKLEQQGGFLGLDRAIEVADGSVKVTEDGNVRQISPLADVLGQQLSKLTERALKVTHTPVSAHRLFPSDGMTNRITIRDGLHQANFEVVSGDETPDEVWDLIEFVSRELT